MKAYCDVIVIVILQYHNNYYITICLHADIII